MVEIMQHVIGMQNVSNTPLETMSETFGLEDLPDKLVNIASETEFDRSNFNTRTFKQVTAGDKTQVKRKYKKPLNVALCAKTVVVLNSMMDTTDVTEGFFRRLVIIPFNQTFKELKAGEVAPKGVETQDPLLKDELLKELPGILNWALEGLTRLIANGYRLTDSKVCNEALEHYRITQNPITEYVKTRIVTGGKMFRPGISQDFVDWCHKYGVEPRSLNTTKFLASLRGVLHADGIEFYEPKLTGDMYINGISFRSYSHNPAADDA